MFCSCSEERVQRSLNLRPCQVGFRGKSEGIQWARLVARRSYYKRRRVPTAKVLVQMDSVNGIWNLSHKVLGQKMSPAGSKEERDKKRKLKKIKLLKT